MDKNMKYTELLKGQISTLGKENRYLEFKSNYQEADRLGRYISALSNGACLDRQDFGYLYFGIEDETLAVVGTTFAPSEAKAKGNEALELYLRRFITPKINFVIDEFLYNGHTRIVVIKIPAAAGEPTCYMGKPWIRVDSHTTELAPYIEWMRTIYNSKVDWTAKIVENATIEEDLDPEAILMARNGYIQRYPDFKDISKEWDDVTFLDKACLTQDGQVTRAAMLLVGKSEKAYKLNHIAQMDWKCLQEGEPVGQLFTIPFIKTTTELMLKIRNYRFKIYPRNSLIPAEVWKYDTRSILEGLHNCVAHQDYGRGERIIVTETKEKISFENAGDFYEGDYEQYVLGDKTPKSYRNPFLMKAMVNVKMIDSQGYGIHSLFERQKERFMPMPDYDCTSGSHVVLHLPGIVIDDNYSRMLMENANLSLTDAILLDHIQKGVTISDDAIAYLRKKKLIEGRKPNLFIAKFVAQNTDRKAEYSKHKGLEGETCESLLLNSLKDHKKLTRQEVDKLLWNALSDMLDEKQKKSKITNLLSKLRKQGKIQNRTLGNKSEWSLLNPAN